MPAKPVGQTPAVVFTDSESAEQAATTVEQWALRAGDTRAVLEGARAILTANEAAVFDTSGGAIGESWPPHADTSAEVGDRLLVMTGRLRGALTDPGNVVVTNDAASLNPHGIPYAHFHLTGTSRMPARPYMGLTRESERAMVELLRVHLAGVGGP